jgi:hypothetical protein
MRVFAVIFIIASLCSCELRLESKKNSKPVSTDTFKKVCAEIGGVIGVCNNACNVVLKTEKGAVWPCCKLPNNKQ